MADFCKQCSIEIFGADYRELADLIGAEAAAQGYATTVICEGCGHIQVNNDGECISEDCDKPGHAVAHKFPDQ